MICFPLLCTILLFLRDAISFIPGLLTDKLREVLNDVSFFGFFSLSPVLWIKFVWGHIEPRVKGFPGISATDTALVKDDAVRGQDDSFCGDWDRWEINGRLWGDLFDSIEQNMKGEGEMAR